MSTKRKMPKRRNPRILANVSQLPKRFLIAEPAQLELTAAEAPAEGQRPKVRSFSMTAYTGGPMKLSGYYWPVVVDLAGMQVQGQSRPILFMHNIERIVGHTETIDVTSQRIKVSGKLSGVGDDVTRVTAAADNGFPWQASIGAEALQLEFVDRGNKVKVNGRNFDGPVYVARKTSLREISFVALGADDNSSASIAANSHLKEPTMGFTNWLKANGWDEASLTADQKKVLLASYEDSLEDDTDPPKIKAGGNPGGNPGPTFNPEDISRQVRDIQAKESERVAAIRAAVTKHNVTTIKIGDGDAAKEVNLEAHAIREGWDADKVELHALRAARPSAPAIHMTPAIPNNGQVLEAAILMNCAFPDVEKRYKPEILEAAHQHYRRIGLQQVLIMAAVANGYTLRAGESVNDGNLREVLEYAFPPRRIAAASTLNVANILTSVANKELLSGYTEENEEWRQIAAIKSVNDFKQATSYRLLDNMEYEEIGADGQIKHGSVSEESYTRQAKTYAKMFSLTRTDIINDDLGAFDDIRTRLGRGAKKKFNNIFWATFMNNSAFFTSGRGNYITGATTNLLVDGVGLEQGVTAFRKLKSPAADGSKKVGNSVGGRPDRLLIPPELEFIAERLHASAFVVGGSSPTPDANIHANKYRPIVVDWLSDSAYTGYSATAWYLMRNPADMAAVVVSFLNGQQSPTVESADADFNTLGIQMRGYHDWGCDQAEYLAGVKSKGAA